MEILKKAVGERMVYIRELKRSTKRPSFWKDAN